ncbi:fumarate reductase flavo protein subunit [Mytilinidion resinicola]|uniref:Fumarate reductase flavo protein subunit n=1 Tax=Mytilinidion resinicola TaxID=574789 RepID=A0A6A6Y5B2_9PEZI|nr:fumarate reductase flavo protein subunit [Mytilinidion resinicola]KAF2803982.1 fumarate reductase flavo protein subunit [Mytilinidion resinicola]
MSEVVYDVIVVGSGNAGFCAAASAVESGASRVLLLEKAPLAWAGGNSTFTAGAYRTVFHSLADVLPLVNNVPQSLASKIDMAPYTETDFLHDLQRVTNRRSDPQLAATLVSESRATTKWLAQNGIKFQLSFNRQAYEIEGRWKFWGGMVLMVQDGGKGLTRQHQENARRKGVEVRYESPVVGLLRNDRGEVTGVSAKRENGETYGVLARGGVVLCAGGFEANASMRARYLGPGWDLAYVRGTPYNTGECLEMAIGELRAKPVGNWSGCHSTCWDANAPTDAGDQTLTNQFTKSGYPLGLMFNVNGRRFVDEGLDLRNYTYAKFGRAILAQDDGVAFQLWDADSASWLRKEEYADDVVERISADTLEELAIKLITKGLKNSASLIESIREYNQAVQSHRKENPELKFDPSKKDGLSTRSSAGGLQLDKTNWALPIAKAPFLAVKVTCGVTFTFGGLKVVPESSAVISESTGKPIPGLYAVGEMVGGLFYGNYPGGSGLTSGAVFGRKAGRSAAQRAAKLDSGRLNSTR